MKRVVYFEIVDIGIRNGMVVSHAAMMNVAVYGLINGFSTGCGTDAESALEDMLYSMQEDDFDITGLESQIKEGWEPSSNEGDGKDVWYHFGIVYRFEV